MIEKRFSLREARPADVDRIYELELAGFAPGIVEQRSVFERRVEAFPEGFLLLVEKATERVQGYFAAEVWPHAEVRYPHEFALNHDISAALDRQGRELYIASYTVDPVWQGQGVGKAFFQASVRTLMEAFPFVDTGLLIVNETWAAALAIYRADGYVQTGRLRDFFHPEGQTPQAALVMKKTLRSRLVVQRGRGGATSPAR